MPDDGHPGAGANTPRDFGSGRGLGPQSGAEEEGNPYDVPEWVSEFRRLYVEPKTPLDGHHGERRRGRRNGAAAPRPVGRRPDPGVAGRHGGAATEQPLSDEPLRSRSARRGRPATADAVGADPDRPPPGPQSRAAMREARAARARAVRRARLRRTVVVGVVLVAVAVVVTWLVARSHDPVSASPAALVVAHLLGPGATGAGALAVDAPGSLAAPVLGLDRSALGGLLNLDLVIG